MNCPNGHGPMTPGRISWFCEVCGEQIALAAGAAPIRPAVPGRFARLPSVLALPLHEYAAEAHPVMRLHRLCDAVEILVRFATFVALGELRQRLGDAPFPESLAKVLRPQIERPTLGQWKNMLRTAVEHLERGAPLVVPELRDVVIRRL